MKNKPLYNTHLHIRQLREELGWTQKFVADEMGVHASNYYLIETGKQAITLPQVIKFWNLVYQKGIDVTLEALITGKKRRSKPVYRTIDKFHTNGR